MSSVGAIGGRRRLVAGIAGSALAHGAAVALVLASDPISVIQPPEQVVPLDIAMFASEPIEVTRTPSAPTPAPALTEPAPQPQAQPRVEARPVPPPVEPKPIVEPKPKPKARPIAQPKPKPPPRRHREERPREKMANPTSMAAPASRRAAKPPAKTTGAGPSGSTARSAPIASARQPSLSASSKGAEQRTYLAALQAAIAARQQYPAEARRSGRVGAVTVAFVILADGRITQIRIAKGSGVPSLDNAALDALRRLGRFRPIPSTLGRASLALRVPVRFDLRR